MRLVVVHCSILLLSVFVAVDDKMDRHDGLELTEGNRIYNLRVGVGS